MPEPFTDAELEAGTEAISQLGIGSDEDEAVAVLRAVLPDHDARVRADERARLAEEIAQAIEEADRHVDVTPAEMARTARTHATTPTTEEDPNAR